MAENSTIVVSKSTKSPGIAVILSLLFGSLGMFYSTILGAVLMIVVEIIIGVITLGVGLIVTHIVCAIWAGIAAWLYNKKLMAEVRR